MNGVRTKYHQRCLLSERSVEILVSIVESRNHSLKFEKKNGWFFIAQTCYRWDVCQSLANDALLVVICDL